MLSSSDAFLNNWLANTSGKPDGFKEIDLLQEHFNFWLKVCDPMLSRSVDGHFMVSW